MRFFAQFFNSQQENTTQSLGSVGLLALSALGIIYGDIGTSPLYTIKECFSPVHGVPPPLKISLAFSL
jgi:K+ transporter